MNRAAFSTEARADLHQAHAHYAAIDARLALRFAQAVDQAVARMVATPARWPEIAAGVRRCLLEGFPYALVYRPQGALLQVIAVRHHRRQPRAWPDTH